MQICKSSSKSCRLLLLLIMFGLKCENPTWLLKTYFEANVTFDTHFPASHSQIYSVESSNEKCFVASNTCALIFLVHSDLVESGIPLSKEGPRFKSQLVQGPLCGVCIFFLCLYWFSQDTPVTSHSPKTSILGSTRDSTLPIGVSVSAWCVCPGLTTCPGCIFYLHFVSLLK